MQNIFFFQTQQILDDTILFNELKQQKIFYSYFQVDQNYYLFVYSQNSIDINFLYQSIHVIEELDSKQRKIRSLRGFFLYALETIENGKDYEILQTNLQPFFWRKVKNIIRQNKKSALQEFLFGNEGTRMGGESDNSYDNKGSNPNIKILKDQIENLQNQVNSLQQKVIQLEARVQQNSKDLLSDATQPREPSKTTQQYNIPSNEEKGPHGSNFITLGKISEDEKIQIIQLGFQLQAKGTISLKKYYEGTDTYSLFQLKGYSIKYEAIRKNKLYQTLKE